MDLVNITSLGHFSSWHKSEAHTQSVIKSSMTHVRRKQTLRSLSLSYQKKDGQKTLMSVFCDAHQVFNVLNILGVSVISLYHQTNFDVILSLHKNMCWQFGILFYNGFIVIIMVQKHNKNENHLFFYSL